MRGPLIIAAGLLVASTSALAYTQKPLASAPNQGEARTDPSFPQPGVMDPPAGSAFGKDGGCGEIRIGVPAPPPETDGMIATLADRLTVERRAGLWWDYARDVVSVASRLANPERTTLLVPTNEAMMRLARKPHQNSDGSAASDDEAQSNVDRFIAAHIIPGDVNLPTTKPLKTLLKGLSVEISKDDDGWVVKPGDLKVVDMKDASNGRILFIDGAIPFPTK